MEKAKVAIIGSGNIGTDLLLKIQQLSHSLEVAALVGIDPDSAGLKRAAAMGIPTTHAGLDGLCRMEAFDEIRLVFDATSAKAHRIHDQRLRENGKLIIDLTPAAIGPYVVPSVNLEQHLDAANINMVTCGGQATIPIVAAIHRISPVVYGEIVASIASNSAGPGTRANIDEFTRTTASAIETVGGAERGKAIIVLNPAEPPILMRNTVFGLVDSSADPNSISDSINRMVADVAEYVPGYRLKQEVQFDAFAGSIDGRNVDGTKVTVFLEVEGAGQYFPNYAGNLDIMTSAAKRTAERIVERRGTELAV